MTITLTDGGIDGGVSPAPQHYMIGCLYPTHAQTALRALRAARPDLVTRVRGLKANASPLSPDELDKLDRLAADRKSTRLNSSHPSISYAVFCLKKKKTDDKRWYGLLKTKRQ